jgi:hypothetical protein
MTLVRALRAPALALAMAALTVQAGQPLVTDDAAVVAAKTCQFEAGVRATRDDALWFAQPACNFGGDVEWSAGGGHLAPDANPSSTITQLQVKAVLFRTTDSKGSLGVSAGAVRDTGAPHGRSAFQGYYARGLASWYPRSDLEFDLNLGVANVRGPGTYAIAGVAATGTVVTGFQLLGEVYHDEPGPWKFQVGWRSIVVPNRFEVYASYGNRFSRSSAGGFAAAGFRLQTPEFLP